MPLKHNGGVRLQSFLISTLDGLSVQHHAPAALLPAKDSPMPTYWLGPTVGLDTLEIR
jgi:hypothetical protein